MGDKMGWIRRLLRVLGPPKPRLQTHGMEADLAVGRMPTVARPKGYPKQPEPVGKRAGYQSDVDHNRAMAGHRREMKTFHNRVAKFNRTRSSNAGITEYEWLAIPGVSCDIGLRNNGKTFSYLKPSLDGHPGEGKCNRAEGCLCMAKPILPGFG